MVGIKIRLTSDIAANGKNEALAYVDRPCEPSAIWSGRGPLLRVFRRRRRPPSVLRGWQRRLVSCSPLADAMQRLPPAVCSLPLPYGRPAHSYERAKEAAEATGLPLMTHHSMSSVDLRGCPGTLRKGDIYTHTYHGWDTTITDQGGLALNPACIEARERGVLFDVSSVVCGVRARIGAPVVSPGLAAIWRRVVPRSVLLVPGPTSGTCCAFLGGAGCRSGTGPARSTGP